MLFGQNNMLITALFSYALGTRLEVGVGTRYWVGNLAGLSPKQALSAGRGSYNKH